MRIIDSTLLELLCNIWQATELLQPSDGALTRPSGSAAQHLIGTLRGSLTISRVE